VIGDLVAEDPSVSAEDLACCVIPVVPARKHGRSIDEASEDLFRELEALRDGRSMAPALSSRSSAVLREDVPEAELGKIGRAFLGRVLSRGDSAERPFDYAASSAAEAGAAAADIIPSTFVRPEHDAPPPLARAASTGSYRLPWMQQCIAIANVDSPKAAGPVELDRGFGGVFSLSFPVGVPLPAAKASIDAVITVQGEDPYVTKRLSAAAPMKPPSGGKLRLLVCRTRDQGRMLFEAGASGSVAGGTGKLLQKVASLVEREAAPTVRDAVESSSDPGWIQRAVAAVARATREITLRLLAAKGTLPARSVAMATKPKSEPATRTTPAKGKATKVQVAEVKAPFPAQAKVSAPAAFSLGGTHFLQGGTIQVVVGRELLTTALTSTSVNRVLEAVPYISMTVGSDKAVAPPFRHLIKKEIPFAQVLTAEGEAIPEADFHRVIRAHGETFSPAELLVAYSNLCTAASTVVRRATAELYALVPAHHGEFVWARVPASGTPRYLTDHVAVPMGGSTVALVSCTHVYMVSLKRTLSNLSGWEATWGTSHTLPSWCCSSGGFTAARVPGVDGIFIAGGKKCGHMIRRVEVSASRIACSWSSTADRVEGRYGHSCCVVGSMLVLFGGVLDSGSGRTNELLAFDTEKDKFVKVTTSPHSGPVPSSRAFHSAVSYLSPAGNAMIVYGGAISSASAAGGEVLLSDFHQVAIQCQNDGSLQVKWEAVDPVDSTPSKSFLFSGTATEMVRFSERRARCSVSMSRGRVILFGGNGPNVEAKGGRRSASRSAELEWLDSTVALRVAGAMDIPKLASTFAMDMLTLARAAHAIGGDRSTAGIESSAAEAALQAIADLIPPEIEFTTADERRFRVHAFLLLLSAPSLRFDLVEACRKAKFRVEFTGPDSLECTPLDDGVPELPDLSDRGYEVASLPGTTLTLCDWSEAEEGGGPVSVEVSASAAALGQVVEFLYLRSGIVEPDRADDVSDLCEELEMEPSVIKEVAKEHGWKIAKGTDLASHKTLVVWATTKDRVRVGIDVRLAHAAIEAQATGKPGLVVEASASANGDSIFRKLMGVLLFGSPEASALRAINRMVEESEADEFIVSALPKPSNFWLNGADVAVRVGPKALLPCHRAVLAARSGFFRGAFTGRLAEATGGVVGVGLDDVHPNAAMLLVYYLYTDLCPPDLDPELAVPLLRLALLHMLPRLRSLCERSIASGFDLTDPESIVGLWHFLTSLEDSALHLTTLVEASAGSFSWASMRAAAVAVGLPEESIEQLRQARTKRLTP
jgi:hypothetical protein